MYETDIKIIAYAVVVKSVQQALNFGYTSHEDYPDIGVHDWMAIVEEVYKIVSEMGRDSELFLDAYNRLSARASAEA